MAKISIIIRTYNEEYWLPYILQSLKKQTIQDFEIINVDNRSKDRGVEILKASKLDVKYVNLDYYLPGKSLNMGCEKASGKILVFVSAHCIPSNEYWLEELSNPILNGNFQAVYGRQIPCEMSNSIDKRDLFLTFPNESRIQKYDSFFHNANSAISKELWTKIPFDNKATNIEDRLFGIKLIQNNIKIYYNSKANVVHYHGLHQSGNEERLNGVVKILEKAKLIEYETDYVNHHKHRILHTTIITKRNIENVDLKILESLNMVITNIKDLDFPLEKHYTKIGSNSKVLELLSELVEHCYQEGYDYVYYKAAEDWFIDEEIIKQGGKMSIQAISYSKKVISQLIKYDGSHNELISKYGVENNFYEINISKGLLIHRSILSASPEKIYRLMKMIVQN